MQRTILALLLAGSGSLSFAQGTVDAGPDTSICVNHYILQGSALGVGEFGQWTLVSGCGTVNDTGVPTSNYVNICVGINVLVWTVADNLGNIVGIDQVAITYYDAAVADASAGPDQFLCLPQTSTQVNASCPTFPATGLWTVLVGSFTITDPTDCFTQFTGLTEGPNIAIWTVDNGPCGITTDTLTILVDLCSEVHLLGSEEGGLLIRTDAYGTAIASSEGIDGLWILDPLGRAVLSFGPQRAGWTLGVDLHPGMYLVAARRQNGTDIVRRFVREQW